MALILNVSMSQVSACLNRCWMMIIVRELASSSTVSKAVLTLGFGGFVGNAVVGIPTCNSSLFSLIVVQSEGD